MQAVESSKDGAKSLNRVGAMYRAERRGESGSPCGTPDSRGNGSDLEAAIAYIVCRFSSHLTRQLTRKGGKPCDVSMSARTLCRREGKNCAISTAKADVNSPASLA